MSSERALRPWGWESRLAGAIAAAALREWSWGEHDCASFAWACGRAMLDGPTAWDSWAGRHRTERGAAQVIRRAGAADLAALMDLGAARIPPAFALRGDVAALRLAPSGDPDPEGAVSLGVVEGATIAVAALRGLRRLPRSVAFAAWPVDPVT